MSGASKRANGGASGPVLYASISYHLSPLCNAAAAAAAAVLIVVVVLVMVVVVDTLVVIIAVAASASRATKMKA